MGFKGAIVNFVARRIKKVVKPYNLPGSVTLKSILAGPAEMAPVAIMPEDVAFLQYTGGTTGIAKGATLTHRNVASNVEQSRALARLGAGAAARAQRLSARHGHGAAALPHLRADLLLHVHAAHRRQGPADRQPARHRRLRQDAEDEPLHAHFRRQHALQRAGEPSRDRPGQFLGAALRGRRRHGDPGRRRAGTGRRSPGGRSSRAMACRRPRRWPRSTGPTSPSSPARSASRCPRPISPSAMPRATTCRSASPARSASAGRRSWPATGTGPTRPPR